MRPLIRTGVVVGTGAALNVSLGFIPDFVFLLNGTDGNHLVFSFRKRVCAFTSGGTRVLAPGDVIQGATSTNVRARIEQVVVTSGTFAGGDAAGFFLWNEDDENGTFGSENVDLLDPSSASVDRGGVVLDDNVAAVSAQTEDLQSDDGTSVVGATGITPYKGTTSAGRGFTVGATLSEDGDLLAYMAVRGDKD